MAFRIQQAFASCGIVAVLLFAGIGCRSAPRSERLRPQVGWRPIVSFSGRGDSQTESFDISSPQWRIKWRTKDLAPAGNGKEAHSPGNGEFHVVVHSAVSGRPIKDAVEQHGDGSGIAYITDDPRLYHLVIESKGVDWSIAVEEAVVGYVQSSR